MNNLSKLTPAQREQMKTLFQENNLGKDDVFTHKHFAIITRSGIEKLQYNNKIKVEFEPVQVTPDFACIKAIGKKGTQTIQTFGSAVKQNCQSYYYAEMAEKRALSRVVLKLLNLYEVGVFGEDENVEKNEVSH